MGWAIPAVSMAFLIGLSFVVISHQVSGTKARPQSFMGEAMAQTVTPRITVEPAPEPLTADHAGFDGGIRTEHVNVSALTAARYPDLPNPSSSISRLKEYIAGLQRSNAQLGAKVESAARHTAEKDAEIVRLTDELGSLGDDYDRLYEMYMKLKEQHDAYAGRLAGLREAGLEASLGAESASYARYGFESQIKELTAKIADLTAAKIEMEERLSQIRRERNDMEHERAMAREDLSRERSRSQVLEKEIASLTAHLQRKDLEVQRLSLPRDGLEAEVQTLKAIKDESDRRILALNTQIAALKSTEEISRAEVVRLTEVVANLRREHEAALRQDTAASDSAQTRRGELTEQVARLQDELLRARAGQDEAARQVLQQERANVRLESMLKKLRMELEMRSVEEGLE